MLLSDLAEAVAHRLNSSPGKWTARSGIQALVTLDWMEELKSDQLRVLVVPEMVQYDLENATGRRNVIAIPTVKFITVMVGKSFTGIPFDGGVAPWEECKEMLDTRERITQFLIHDTNRNVGKAKLADIEEVPVDELELDKRNFIAMNQLGYEILQCGSGPDLLSS